jgi:hypothetical protein
MQYTSIYIYECVCVCVIIKKKNHSKYEILLEESGLSDVSLDSSRKKKKKSKWRLSEDCCCWDYSSYTQQRLDVVIINRAQNVCQTPIVSGRCSQQSM